MINGVISWTNPTTYTDDSAYDGAKDNAGYVIKVDAIEGVAVPVGWTTSFDLKTLALWSSLKRGNHTVQIAAVSKEGAQSDFSAPTTFPIIVPPNAPTSVRVD